jgi:hypothetical protein
MAVEMRPDLCADAECRGVADPELVLPGNESRRGVMDSARMLGDGVARVPCIRPSGDCWAPTATATSAENPAPPGVPTCC